MSAKGSQTQIFVENIICDVVTYTKHAKRKTVTVMTEKCCWVSCAKSKVVKEKFELSWQGQFWEKRNWIAYGSAHGLIFLLFLVDLEHVEWK